MRSHVGMQRQVMRSHVGCNVSWREQFGMQNILGIICTPERNILGYYARGYNKVGKLENSKLASYT